MKTFITFIGRGAPGKETGYAYKMVNYQFENGSVRASCFANAVLACRKDAFDRVCIIGTTSSTWEQLLEPDIRELSPEEKQLQNRLKAIPDGPFPQAELKDFLQKRWNIPDVRFIVHDPALTGHENEIQKDYLQLILDCQDEIVLDVTHSFRWMPQFLTSAIQLADALQGNRKLTILYGEFSAPDGICPVRELDALWQERKTAEDVRLFFEKWEAEPLAKRIEKNWSTGADSLRELSRHLQGNYLIPLVWNKDKMPTPLQKLANALQRFPSEDVPFWQLKLKEQLQNLCDRLTAPQKHSEQLMVLADLYAERKLYGQALLCQEIALRIFQWETCGGSGYPRWEDLERVKKRDHELRRQNLKNRESDMRKLNQIFAYRNTVAHGALADSHRGGAVPQVANLPGQYKSNRDCLLKLFGRKR